MKLHNRFSIFALQFILAGSFLFFFQNKTTAQVQVGVTVISGNSSTTCGDIFGSPDPLWRVRVGTGAWTTFSNNNSEACYASYPSLEWSFPFFCQTDIPTSIQVCFRAFENDGLFGCDVTESCLEEICQNFIVPSPGNIANYTLSLPAGGDSEGEVNFAIGAIGTPFTSPNDEICNAENMGMLPSGGTLGDANAGGFNNLCATNTNEISPSDSSNLFWINNQGVWFEFTTSNSPGYEININALSDPLNLGVPMNIELAVYESDDGTCNGNLTLVNSAFNAAPFDESIILSCPQPNTTYFILVDGNDFDLEMRGHFGLEIIDNGAMAAPDRRCDAYDLGMIPTGGNSGVYNVHNECADNLTDPNPTAFISQKSVWFYFQAPPSGSVEVAVLSVDGAPWNNGIGAQIGVYRSFNNMCTGFFSEVGSSFTIADNDETLELNCLTPGDSYWILVDGSGSNTAGVFDVVVTDLENYPPEMTLDPVVCFGDSYQVGNAIYTASGNYTYVFNLLSGCDSTVYTNLTVADSLDANAQQVTLASSPTAPDGAVIANPIGGTPPYSYLWSNGVTTSLNDNIPPGNYCVTVTDAIGCEAVSCIDLEYSLIAVTATNDVLNCFGDTNGMLSFFVENGTAPYLYTYFNSDTTITASGNINADGEVISLNNLPAGNYQINIEDTDGNMTMTIASVIEPNEIATVQDYTICFGKSIVIGNTTYDASGAILEILQAANGCDSTVTGMLTILPDPSISIDSTICFGENITIANSTYSTTGIFTDTLQNADGCDSIITTNLMVLDEITASINPVILPSGYNQADGTAQVTATGGTGNFTYSWSNGQTGTTATNLLGGTEYCVTVTDANGCTNETCNTILYQPNIAIALNDTLDCFGNTDGAITIAVANGLGDYNFSWENTDTGTNGNGTIIGNIGTAIIPDLEKGNYQITVTDTYVSTTINTMVVEPSLLTIQPITAQGITCVGDCNGSIVINPSGGTTPYSYAWSGGIAPVQDPTNLCAIDYTVTVTDAKGCTATTLVSIPEPTPFSVTIDEMEAISCGGESDGVLLANPVGGTGTSFQYSWNNNSLAENINGGLNTGIYFVTVTDEAGCTTMASYQLDEPTPVNFDLNITDVDCWHGLNSGSIVIENTTGGLPPYTYALGQNGYQQVPSFGQITAGSYQVYAQDANGCVANQIAIVELPEEINVNLGGDHQIFLGETVELEVTTTSNNALIEWNVDSCQNCPTLELTPIHTNIYTVNVLDTITGCSDADQVWIYVSKDRKVFIPNAFSPNEDGHNDYFTIFADAKSIRAIRNLRVFNRWGALVFERKELEANQESQGWDGFYNNQQLQNGVYIYTVEIDFIDGETELFKGSVTLTK
ncbi:MAG TPA: T9SS type B sorting domain-containing protein [Phaeodactylibacter sp.]|nr:T9SS type B sorting domain-containing protein [Phaeodactylibacter sp.]